MYDIKQEAVPNEDDLLLTTVEELINALESVIGSNDPTFVRISEKVCTNGYLNVSELVAGAISRQDTDSVLTRDRLDKLQVRVDQLFWSIYPDSIKRIANIH